MAVPVRLQDIIDALEMQFDEQSHYLDLANGEIEVVSHDLLRAAEEYEDEEPDLSDWEKHEWEIAKRIVGEGGFRKLPSQHDIHEWSIMRDFCDSVESPAIRAELLDAIHGAGAFRMFKSAIRRRGVEKDWYAFRSDALRQIAIDWCEEHGIAYEEHA